MNVEHNYGEDIVPNMTRSQRGKYITYYEDSESIPGKRTAVWELDKGNVALNFHELRDGLEVYFIAFIKLFSHH